MGVHFWMVTSIPGLHVLAVYSITISPKTATCPLRGQNLQVGNHGPSCNVFSRYPVPPPSSPWGLPSAVPSFWRSLSTPNITAAHHKPPGSLPAVCPHSTYHHFLFIICLFSLDRQRQRIFFEFTAVSPALREKPGTQ